MPKSSLGAGQRWGLLGNARTIELLQHQITHGLKSHAFLFVGPRGIGKATLCRSFAAALLCLQTVDGVACGDCASCAALSHHAHPDVHTLTGGNDLTIGIETVRTLRRILDRRPILSPRHVVILDRADTLTEEAANALLKTLEEPSGTTVILLTAPSARRLPPTIASRCALYALTALAEDDLRDALVSRGLTKREAGELAAFVDGRPAYALFLAEQRTVYSQAINDTQQLLELLDRPLHERLAAAEKLNDRISDPSNREYLIERWESLGRRLLRAATGLHDRGPLAEQIRAVASRLGLDDCWALVTHLERARDFFSGTGSSRLAIESLLIHLPKFI